MTANPNAWDSIFNQTTVPTGAAANPTPKSKPVVPDAVPTVAKNATTAAPSVAEVADDLFATFLGGADNEPDEQDDSDNAADLAGARTTLAGILQEAPKAAVAPVPTQPVAVPAEVAPKKKGRGPAKKTPVTAETFVKQMSAVDGGSQAAESLFPETVATNDVPAATPVKEANDRENAAIEAAVKFLASILISRLQS